MHHGEILQGRIAERASHPRFNSLQDGLQEKLRDLSFCPRLNGHWEREREREIYRFDYGSCTVLSFFFFLEKVQFWVWDCVRQIKWKTKHTDEIAVQVYKRKGVQFSAISVKITNILYLYLCDVVWYHSLQIFEKRNFQYFLWQRNISLLQFPKGNYFCNLILLYEITILTLSRSNY